MPVVIVEVEARAASPALVRAMVAACTSSIREGRCELAAAGEDETAEAVAIVRWHESAELRADVEVAVRRRGEAAAWQSRTLDFQRDDSRLERWRSVGLTIATLAGELSPATETPAAGTAGSEEAPPAPPPPAPEAASAAPPVSPDVAPIPSSDTSRRRGASPGTPASRAPRGWLGAGAGLGSAVGSGIQLGGHFEGGYQVAAFFTRASLGLYAQPGGAGDASVDFVTGSLSAGVSLGSGPLVLRPRAGLRVERMSASIERRGTAPEGSASQLQVGFVAGVDATVSSGPNGLVLGIELFRNRAPAEVRIGGSSAGTYSATGWFLNIGYRYGF